MSRYSAGEPFQQRTALAVNLFDAEALASSSNDDTIQFLYPLGLSSHSISHYAQSPDEELPEIVGGDLERSILRPGESEKKRKLELDSNSSSHRETSRLRDDLDTSSTRVKSLEIEVHHLQTRITEMEILFTNERKSLEERAARDRSRSEELEAKREACEVRESRLREKLSTTTEENMRQRHSLESRIRELERQNTDLERKLLDSATSSYLVSDFDSVQAGSSDANNQISTKVALLNASLREAQQTVDLEKSISTRLREELKEMTAKYRAAASEIQQFQQLEQRAKSVEESEALLQHYKAEASKAEEAERQWRRASAEVKTLKDRISNEQLLKEEIATLKKHADKVTAVSAELAEYKSKWEAMLSMEQSFFALFSPSTTPMQVQARLRELQQEAELLLDKQGTLNMERTKAVETAARAVERNEQLETELIQLKREMSGCNAKLEQKEREVVVAARDRDRMRALLDSYNMESISGMAVTKPKENSEETPVDNKAHLQQQISELEAAISKRDDEAAELRQQLVSIQEELAEQKQRAAEAEMQKKQAEAERETAMQQVSSASTRAEKLDTMLKKSEEEAAKLMQRVGKGEFNAATTKVLHFGMGPQAVSVRLQMQKELDAAQAELTQCKERIRSLEASAGVSENAAKELETLRHQLQEKDMSTQRLKEIFSKTSKEFRDTCFQLFGWKIDLLPENRYRLRSMYAERDEDHLLFTHTAQHGLQMMETKYTNGLEKEIELFLGRWHSIPGFLAHITSNLFTQRTGS